MRQLNNKIQMKYFVYEIFETTAFIYERCEVNVEASVQAFFWFWYI